MLQHHFQTDIVHYKSVDGRNFYICNDVYKKKPKWNSLLLPVEEDQKLAYFMILLILYWNLFCWALEYCSSQKNRWVWGTEGHVIHFVRFISLFRWKICNLSDLPNITLIQSYYADIIFHLNIWQKQPCHNCRIQRRHGNAFQKHGKPIICHHNLLTF